MLCLRKDLISGTQKKNAGNTFIYCQRDSLAVMAGIAGLVVVLPCGYNGACLLSTHRVVPHMSPPHTTGLYAGQPAVSAITAS